MASALEAAGAESDTARKAAQSVAARLDELGQRRFTLVIVAHIPILSAVVCGCLGNSLMALTLPPVIGFPKCTSALEEKNGREEIPFLGWFQRRNKIPQIHVFM